MKTFFVTIIFMGCIIQMDAQQFYQPVNRSYKIHLPENTQPFENSLENNLFYLLNNNIKIVSVYFTEDLFDGELKDFIETSNDDFISLHRNSSLIDQNIFLTKMNIEFIYTIFNNTENDKPIYHIVYYTKKEEDIYIIVFSANHQNDLLNSLIHNMIESFEWQDYIDQS